MKSAKKPQISKNFDNTSLTAYRIIKIFNLLLESPLSEDEIKDALKDETTDLKLLSSDTVSIYINTLKSIGCRISRPCKSNSFKYRLEEHPFKINLSKEEIFSLIKIKKYIASFDDWKLFQNTDEVISKILLNINEEGKNNLKEVTKFLKREISAQTNPKLLKTLEKYCADNRTLHINYLSPASGEKVIMFTAEKINFENNAFYLWGVNAETSETQYIRIDRIKEIKAINIKTAPATAEIYTVAYSLKGQSAKVFIAEETEKILKKNDKEILISAVVQNKFRFIQKMLSFGEDCTVISPDVIKKEVIQKLQSMSNGYKQ